MKTGKKVTKILQYICYPLTVNFIFIPAPSSAKSRQSYAANSRSSVANQNGHAEPKVDPKAAPGGRLCLLEPEVYGFILQFKVIGGKNLKIKTSIELVYYTGLHISSSLKRLHKGIFLIFMCLI